MIRAIPAFAQLDALRIHQGVTGLLFEYLLDRNIGAALEEGFMSNLAVVSTSHFEISF
jgi:hypothetical protein